MLSSVLPRIRTQCCVANYDVSTVHDIINTTPVVHVSFVPDPMEPVPVVLPMIGQMGLYPEDDEWSVYLHGYVSSRLMKLGGPPGVPVCVAATKVDGLVLSLTPNTHNYNYRSAVVHGRAQVLSQGSPETLWAMELVTNSVVADRWPHTRLPPDNAEIQSTRILKVKVESASAKVRVGWPEDERKDLKRDDVLDTVWTGVLPVWEQIGEPVPGPYNRVEKIPEHVSGFVKTWNKEAEGYAKDAAVHEPPPKRKKKEDED